LARAHGFTAEQLLAGIAAHLHQARRVENDG
jgi:hypothetical protein